MESSLNILSSYSCSLSSPINFSREDIKFDLCFLFWLPLLQFVRPSPLTLIIVLNSLLAFLSPALPPLNSSSKLPSDFVPRLLHSFTWSLTSKAWTLAPSPRLPQQMCKQLLSLQVLVDNDLCSELSPFCLPSTYCCLRLWGSEAPHPVPACEGVSECVETFPPSQLPPWDAGLCPFIFFPFYLLPYPILWR